MRTSPFVWSGRVLSGVVVAFLGLDAALKLAGRADLLQAGIAVDAPPALLGGALLVATTLYALPRTAVWGALALSLALGGSAASQAAAGDPAQLLFAVYVAVLMWIGLILRKPGFGPILLRAVR
ncbi:hypothetical protein [Brevundimonas sp.]|uniref:hypothetical protein n=1 Tax=Brevundimonas sp. TaxID=1871086 RepID=UPI002D6525C3|nr:hypothetical protein [Brevundimonas sp.]HYC98413.1 hypothetical protein [Brevundimonas sp.]